MRRSSSCAHIATSFFSSAGSSIREYEPDTLWLVLRLRLWVGPPPSGPPRRKPPMPRPARAAAMISVGSLFVRRCAPRRCATGAGSAPGAPSTSIGELRPAAESIGASARASKVTLC